MWDSLREGLFQPDINFYARQKWQKTWLTVFFIRLLCYRYERQVLSLVSCWGDILFWWKIFTLKRNRIAFIYRMLIVFYNLLERSLFFYIHYHDMFFEFPIFFKLVNLFQHFLVKRTAQLNTNSVISMRDNMLAPSRRPIWPPMLAGKNQYQSHKMPHPIHNGLLCVNMLDHPILTHNVFYRGISWYLHDIMYL